MIRSVAATALALAVLGSSATVIAHEGTNETVARGCVSKKTCRPFRHPPSPKPTWSPHFPTPTPSPTYHAPDETCYLYPPPPGCPE